MIAYFDDIWIYWRRKLHDFGFFLFVLFLPAEPESIEELETIVTLFIFFHVVVAVAGACIIGKLAPGPPPLNT